MEVVLGQDLNKEVVKMNPLFFYLLNACVM